MSLGPLVLDGPQTMLAKTAAEFAAKCEPVDRLRRLRDQEDDLCYSPEVWSEMAELGWPAIPFAEDAGGLGMGLSELVLVTEELGRGLAPEPLISSAVLAGRVLANEGGDSHADWLSATISGEKRLALAYQEEGSRYHLNQVSTKAEQVGDGWRLEGKKIQVIDGHRADGWIVSARTSGEPGDTSGITLFLVPADREGVRATQQHRVDSRNAAMVEMGGDELGGVEMGEADVVGAVGEGYEPLEDAVDAATVALCGEMLGGMCEALERTLDYLKEREQFGVRIGSFQALKHRAAKMFIEVELAKSVVMAAARSIDSGAEDAKAQVSNAKARCSDAFILVTNEALQMHGGIGMTDEHDIGLFMKRARVCEMTFGDAAYHRQRFAALKGF